MKKVSQFKEGMNIYNDVTFFLHQKDIKNLIIKLNSKNEIVVSVPLKIDEKILTKFLDINLIKFQQHQNLKKENITIDVENCWFYLFGEKIFYKNEKATKELIINNEKISYANKTVNKAIAGYKKEQLNAYILVKQMLLQKIMNIVDHEFKIRLKYGAWGTNYTLKKVIYYSTELASFSKKTIDYVIIHELAHNKFRHHSRDFWNFVSIYEPNYKLHRLKLRKLIYF